MLDLSKEHRFRSRNSQILQDNGQLVTVQGVLWAREQAVGLDVKPPHFAGCTCEDCEAVISRVCEKNQDKAAQERSVASEFARLMAKRTTTVAKSSMSMSSMASQQGAGAKHAARGVKTKSK